MSDMALTVTQVGRNNVIGNRISTTLKVVPDDSWLAAGESLDLTAYGPSIIETVLIDPSSTGYVWQYDRTNKKLLAFEAGSDGAALDAVTYTTALSSTTIHITVTGTRA